MTLDDMQTIWQQYDGKLGELLRVQTRVGRAVALNRVRTTMERLARNLRLETLINAVAVMLLGGFAAEHVRQPVAFAAAVALDLYALAILIGGIFPLAMLAGIDYDRPILDVTRMLDRVRIIRARVTMWTLFAAPLMWPPLLIVGMSALLRADAWAAFGYTWMLANLAFGVAVLAIGVAFARRFDSRRRPGTAVHPLVVALSGRSLRDAAAQIAALERYEADVD